jgi:nucleoside-diphosphate-sugar epimerase
MGNQVIWLTGSSGFIGRCVVAELREHGHTVLCFSNAGIGDRASEAKDERHPLDFLSAPHIQSQIRQFGLPDAFIHLAWADMAQPETNRHLEENVKAGQTLIDTLYEAGLKKFVFIGSMNEYGARVGALQEDMPPEGRLTNYARGKIKVTQHGYARAAVFKRVFLHIRPFYVFGAGQRKGSLINDLHEAFQSGRDVQLGPCEHYRDFIHVSDVAQGIRRLLPIETSTTVNLGSGRVIQVKEYVRLFWAQLGGDPAKLRFGARPMRANEPAQPQSYADLTRLKQLTSWTPALTLEQGIARTVEDLRRTSPPGHKPSS